MRKQLALLNSHSTLKGGASTTNRSSCHSLQAVVRISTKRKQLEADDPFEMVGVFLPVDSGEDATAEMARAFVEEYALMGFSAERILRLFKSPFYASVHLLYRQRGEAFVQGLIEQVLSPVGREEGCA